MRLHSRLMGLSVWFTLGFMACSPGLPRLDAGSLPSAEAGRGEAGPVDAGRGDGGPRGADGGLSGELTWPWRSGPYAVSTDTFKVTRAGRETPVVLYLPNTVEPPPVVLFSPGFQLESARYTALAAHLSSHGYAVAMADPAASFLSVSHVEMAADMAAVLAEARMRAPWNGEVTAVAMGHSLGGKIAVMLAASEPAVRAVLALDPVNGGRPFGGYSDALPDVVPEVVRAITVPILLFGETTNATASGPGQACAPTDQNFQTFFDAVSNASWAIEVDVLEADHMDFVDDLEGCGLVCRACPDGTADHAAVGALTRGLTVAFLHAAVQGGTLDAFDVALGETELGIGVRRTPN